MPPCYDIYGLSKERNKKTIEKFLNHFSHRDKIEIRTGQEILVNGNQKYNVNESCTPISTLSEVINYGINDTIQGFVFYISDNLKEGINGLILKFTYDGKVILEYPSKKSTTTKMETCQTIILKLLKYKDRFQLTLAYKSSIQFDMFPLMMMMNLIRTLRYGKK